MNRTILLVIAVVLGPIFAFFTGIGVGISATTEAKPLEFVSSAIGSVGDWVSGIGALAAAVIAITLADRQRRASFPRIKLLQSAHPYGFHIDIISVGDRGALVTGVFLRSRRYRGQARLATKTIFPKRLEFGDVEGLTIEGVMYRKIAEKICGDDEIIDLSDLEVVVETSMKAHVYPADSAVIGLIEGTLSISEHYEG